MLGRIERVEGSTFLTGGRALENGWPVTSAPPPPPPPPSEPSIGRVVERSLKETRELIALEFALAFKAVSRTALGMMTATMLLLIAVSVITVVLVLALGGSSMIGLIGAAVLIAVGAAAGAIGIGLLPRPPARSS